MDEKKYLKLSDIEAYRIAFHLSNFAWSIVINWEPFAKANLGGQFVRAVDSISANIAEGFGRFGKKDKIKFYRIAQGSLLESLDWNEKAKRRGILLEDTYQYILTELQKLPKAINSLIKYTNESLAV